ncbi:Uncharacterised protein [Collinsella aerofaciens]|uniref:Uncharacterized protein n=1 Tax=Collinsella aerofaciens TaxID=74426 RepID=A0A5K1ILC7_9ACTN|nr:Uncharacterised protein [Collinsella aerofaciens]
MTPNILVPESLTFSPGPLIEVSNDKDQDVCNAQNGSKVMIARNYIATQRVPICPYSRTNQECSNRFSNDNKHGDNYCMPLITAAKQR